MKNIYDILKEFGLEIPAEKKADFDKLWKENYRTKSEYDNAVTKRDEYKTSLDDVNAKLKEFEGVDVNDLKGQISKLQGDIAAKDAEYARRETERQFNDSLDKAITEIGGRNTKAVRALLDVESLMQSKNQTEDIKKHWKLQRHLMLIYLVRMNRLIIRYFQAAEILVETICRPSGQLWVCRIRNNEWRANVNG